jgi:hypothetical protein
LDGVVANQENAFAKHHERFKSGSDAMACKIEIAHLVFPGEQPASQRTGIGEKILLEPGFSRTRIRKQMALVSDQRNDGPFIKNDFLIPLIHLRGAGFD